MKKKVILGILVIFLIALVPLFVLKDAEFTPILETIIGGELPGEVESLFFCIQTGIGVGIIAFIMGRFVERRKWMNKEGDSRDYHR